MNSPLHEKGGSYATVKARANLTNRTQRVYYYIRWDAEVAPAGTHLGQKPGQASNGWVEDLSQNGESVGNRGSSMARYFNEGDQPDPTNGLIFNYTDGIAQPQGLNNGTWGFKLSVVDESGVELDSKEVTLDWNH